MYWFAVSVVVGSALVPPPVDFNRDIRPLLVARCYACHGPDKDARKARLSLHTREGSIERNPPVIVPGDADASLLIERVSDDFLDDRMPLSGEPLSAEEIDLMRRWIDSGAKYDEPWSWQPLAEFDADASVDSLINARLAEVGLSPASPAPPEAQLRRLAFDLTGLPPTAAELEAFLLDPNEQAYAAFVDEYLDRPQFGEAWARHWLDLVAYADTRGHEFDYPIREAWRYRDWVVRAFNSDLPYDRFVAEQIAGDILDPRPRPQDGTNEALLATGFWFLGQEVHAPTDVVQDHADRTAEQLIVFGQGILGLTVACARCHDHKFDPISAKDYYALSAFTQSFRQSYGYQDPNGTIAAAVAKLSKVSKPDMPLAPISIELPGTVDEESVVIESFDGNLESNWREAGFAFDGLESTRFSTLNSGRLDKRLQGTARSRDFTLDRRYVHALVRGKASKVRLVVEAMRMDEFNALLFDGYIQAIGPEEEVGWTHIVHDTRRHPGTRAFYELIDDGNGFIDTAALWLSDRADGLPPNLALPTKPFTPEEHPVLAEHQDALLQVVPELPAPRRVLAAHEGFGETHPLYYRGSHKTPREAVERSFLDRIAGEQEPIPSEHGSGRLILVERIFDPGNPFPSRVMANRLWHLLFGRGLVATTDDFGGLGSPPTHPDLLDWLATRFQTQETPWSIKGLLRTILLSDTYRRRTRGPEDSPSEVDPNNDLLGFARLRRLRAEQLRDAMLAISGKLDETQGGPPVAIHLTEFMTGRGRPGASGPLNGNNRRSLYLGIHRNFAHPMLSAFDCPTPNAPMGRRNTSNVPAQSLALMNDPFVLEVAVAWAKKILATPELLTNEERVRLMSLEAFGRIPSDEEMAIMLSFLAEGQPQEQFEALAHAHFLGKSFLFME
jgi:hypothetical protein